MRIKQKNLKLFLNIGIAIFYLAAILNIMNAISKLFVDGSKYSEFGYLIQACSTLLWGTMVIFYYTHSIATIEESELEISITLKNEHTYHLIKSGPIKFKSRNAFIVVYDKEDHKVIICSNLMLQDSTVQLLQAIEKNNIGYTV